MPDAHIPSEPLNDDEVRWLLVRTAASLNRLWARIHRLAIAPAEHVSQDISPAEPWLDALPRNVAMSGVVRAVILAQALLVDEAVAERSPDRRRACLIVQHIQCGATAWSRHTTALAAKIGVTLAASVMVETNGCSLHSEIYRLDGTYARHKASTAGEVPTG